MANQVNQCDALDIIEESASRLLHRILTEATIFTEKPYDNLLEFWVYNPELKFVVGYRPLEELPWKFQTLAVTLNNQKFERLLEEAKEKGYL